MGFVRLWLEGCIGPIRFIDVLKSKPAPHWGIYGQLLRSACPGGGATSIRSST